MAAEFSRLARYARITCGVVHRPSGFLSHSRMHLLGDGEGVVLEKGHTPI